MYVFVYIQLFSLMVTKRCLQYKKILKETNIQLHLQYNHLNKSRLFQWRCIE